MNQLLQYRLFAAILLCFFSNRVNAQDLPLQWARGITGTGSAGSAIIEIDNLKNTYISGSFSGTIDFDPGNGTVNLTSDTSFGKGNYFLAKYDAQGNLIFVRQIGAFVTEIVMDKSWNICMVGNFSSKKDFDPGLGTAALTSAGKLDMFMAKYTSDGNYISAIRIGGPGTDDINDITLDASGNVYITGSFEETVDFDPGVGTLNLVSNDDDNIFFAKYSGIGIVTYAISLKGTGTGLQQGLSLAVDANENVYLGGRFSSGTVDLDPGSGTASFTATTTRGFVAKYDPSGNYLSSTVYVKANIYYIALDGSGNSYQTGTMSDSMDMDPGPGVAMLRSTGIFDTWLAKYDAAGNYVYATVFECNDFNNPWGMAVNHHGDLYLHGIYRDSIDLNPGGSNGKLIDNTSDDSYLAKFDAAGKFLFGFSYNNSGEAFIESLALDPNGSVWLAGDFSGTVDFDPGVGIANLTSTPKTGIFFGRYTDPDAVGISRYAQQSPMKIYGADNKVFVDFPELETVNASVKVINMMGQTIAETDYAGSDKLKIELPETAGQVYIVIVSNDGIVTAKKVWVN